MAWCWNGPSEDNASQDDHTRDHLYRPVLMIGLVGLFAGIVLFRLYYDKISAMDSWLRLLISTSPYQLFAFFAVIVAMFGFGIIRRDGFRLSFDIFQQKASFGALLSRNLRLLLIIYPISMFFNMLAILLGKIMGWQMQEQIIAKDFAEGGPMLYAVSAISILVLAPITEEVLMRLVCYRGLRSLLPIWASILTSLLFGFMHGNPYTMVGLSIVGYGFLQARKQGGLPQAILMHSMYNLIAYSILVFYSYRQ